jgi:hypothetical protein
VFVGDNIDNEDAVVRQNDRSMASPMPIPGMLITLFMGLSDEDCLVAIWSLTLTINTYLGVYSVPPQGHCRSCLARLPPLQRRRFRGLLVVEYIPDLVCESLFFVSSGSGGGGSVMGIIGGGGFLVGVVVLFEEIHDGETGRIDGHGVNFEGAVSALYLTVQSDGNREDTPSTDGTWPNLRASLAPIMSSAVKLVLYCI